MMVSNAAIEELCGAARAAGAFGSKLTGAGGGGAVVALLGANDDAEASSRGERVLASWAECGYEGFLTHVDGKAAHEECA